jgi:integrase
MGIKYDEEKKYYIVTYSRRHPVTRKPRNLRRQGIKSKAEAQKVYKKLIIELGEKFHQNLHPLWPILWQSFWNTMQTVE